MHLTPLDSQNIVQIRSRHRYLPQKMFCAPDIQMLVGPFLEHHQLAGHAWLFYLSD
jgi:hypothetical protein